MKILLNILVYFGIALLIGGIISLRQKFFPKTGDINVNIVDFKEIMNFKKKKFFKIKFKVRYPNHLVCNYQFKKDTEYLGLIDDPKYNILFQDEQKVTYKIPIKKYSDVIEYTILNSNDFSLISDMLGIFTDADNYKE